MGIQVQGPCCWVLQQSVERSHVLCDSSMQDTPAATRRVHGASLRDQTARGFGTRNHVAKEREDQASSFRDANPTDCPSEALVERAPTGFSRGEPCLLLLLIQHQVLSPLFYLAIAGVWWLSYVYTPSILYTLNACISKPAGSGFINS